MSERLHCVRCRDPGGEKQEPALPHGARCQFRTQRSHWAMSYMVTYTVTGASQGTLGAGLGTQDWLLCAGAPGLEL